MSAMSHSARFARSRAAGRTATKRTLRIRSRSAIRAIASNSASPNLVTIRGDRYRDALTYIDSLDVVLELEPERLDGREADGPFVFRVVRLLPHAGRVRRGSG